MKLRVARVSFHSVQPTPSKAQPQVERWEDMQLNSRLTIRDDPDADSQILRHNLPSEQTTSKDYHNLMHPTRMGDKIPRIS